VRAAATATLEAVLGRFARDHGLSDEKLERFVRCGIEHAIDDAEDVLNLTFASLLRGVTERIPLEQLLDLLDQIGGF
jgi:hypothetical protein